MSKTENNFPPFYINLLLIQYRYFHQHHGQHPGRPFLPPSSLYFLTITKSITKSCWFSGLSIFWSQLTSQCSHYNHHNLPVSINVPVQCTSHKVNWMLSLVTVLFKIIWWYPLVPHFNLLTNHKRFFLT